MRRYLTRSEKKAEMELLIKDPHKHKEKEMGKETRINEKRKMHEIHFFQISSSTFKNSLQDPI